MNIFAKRFGQLCVEKKVTLRKISDATGKSINYWSDVKYGRRIPPKDDVVQIVEEVLEDNSLRKLAEFVRQTPKEFSHLMRTQPEIENLAMTLLRAENELSEEDLNKKLKKAQEIFEVKEDQSFE